MAVRVSTVESANRSCLEVLIPNADLGFRPSTRVCKRIVARGNLYIARATALDPVAESASCAAYSSFLISEARLSYGPY